MNRHDMIERIGASYVTANIEGGEYSYVQEAGSREALEKLLGKSFKHFKLDIRFEDADFVVLIETKQNYVESDADQLREYLEEERALHPGKKVICILANTNNDKLKVWKSFVDDVHLLPEETVLDTMEHYKLQIPLKYKRNSNIIDQHSNKIHINSFKTELSFDIFAYFSNNSERFSNINKL